MRLLFILLFSAVVNICAAQDKWYVAAKNGLSLREKPDVKSAVLGKIPYSTVITIVSPDSTLSITTEGIRGTWVKTNFDGKAGYVINSYLLPQPPPKPTVKTMKAYLAQLSTTVGTPLVVKSAGMLSDGEGGSETKKQFYKNGAEHHSLSAYESHNDAYFLPGFTLEQGFILLRLLPEFNGMFSEADVFPAKSGVIKKNGHEYSIKVDAETIGSEKWVKRIAIEYEDGVIYSFEMFLLGDELVISFGGGV